MKNIKAVLGGALRGLAALCLCTVLLLDMAVPAFTDVIGEIIIKVDNESLLKMLAGGTKITLCLYRLAGRTGDYLSPEWVFAETPEFADLAARITEYESRVRTDGYPDDDTLLDDIESVISEKHVTPVSTGEFSEDGTVTFSGLSEGMYFFMMTDGPARVKIKSAIVPVPFVYKGGMHYDPIELTAKAEISPTPPTPTPPGPPTPPTPTPTKPVNPPQKQKKAVVDGYDVPLGIAAEINHVGDCYE